MYLFYSEPLFPWQVVTKSPPTLETESAIKHHKPVEQTMRELVPNSRLEFYSQPNNRALQLLIDNLNLVEEAYLHQLGYVITEQRAEQVIVMYVWRGGFLLGCITALIIYLRRILWWFKL